MPSPSGGSLLAAVLVFWALFGVVTSVGDWSECPATCKCKWVHGRKMAECTSADLTIVPDTLSPEIQWLDLSNNKFNILQKEAFKEVGLVNLQKLFLKSCEIQTLHKEAFRGLVLLIELDLSDNAITTLHPSTFRENFRLRVLYLNRNHIEKMDGELFTNHTFLQTVELSDCRIKHLGPKTFSNAPGLQQLTLDGNELTYLRLSTFALLDKLKSLVLNKNPWRCDCKLRPLRDWVVDRKLYAQPTTCSEPERLRDKFWNHIPSEEFACRPQLVLPTSSVAAYPGGNVTLSCRAAGDPSPSVQWVLNSLVLGNSTRPHYSGYRQHYVVHRGESRNQLGEYWTWTNLTIIDAKHYDSGKYSCGAKNPGGVAEEILTLGVREGAGGFIITGANNTLWTWLVALIIAAFILLVFVLLLCFCLCRRKSRRNAHHRNSVIKKHETQLTSNGDINVEDDQEKALITKINPLAKPPRRIESGQSSLNGSQGGELHHADLQPVNNMRTRASEGSGDHSQSGDLLLGRSYDSLDCDEAQEQPPKSGRGGEAVPSRPDGRTYPDLLAFPPRAGHDSPGSSTSTAPDSTRLPLQSPVMLLSPHLANFGTLPYARSHSPFSPTLSAAPNVMGSCGSLPIVTTRPGYVTIPRRPRAPSWAAPLRSGDPLLKIEPIYDNLGPRTTADGSSVLSLNKTGDGGTLTRTPNRSHIRPRPATPTLQLPTYYAPIEEVPSPAPTRHKMAPPRSSPEGSKQKASPREEPKTIESGLISPRKVPPKVPPKPKKKTQVVNGGGNQGDKTLYEDEGEDGTEV